jgi:hypothetical protein
MKMRMGAALAVTIAAASAAGAQPARRAAPQLPIQQGYYVADFEPCGNTMSVFRYDGRRIGWYGAQREANEMEPIRSARRRGNGWEVQITNRDPDRETNPTGLTPVLITPRGQNRISVEVQEEIPMRLCAPAALPRWMRGR